MNSRFTAPVTIAFSSIFLLFNSCRKSDTNPSSQGGSSTVIASPVMLDLIPAENVTSGIRRIFLPVSAVGGVKSGSLKLVFDSGSEGVLFSATSLFSAAQIADTGIVINSADSAIISGITVTSAKVTSIYGDPPATRTFYGNIAYAPLTLGDQSGAVVTARMPFILVYKGVDNQTGASVVLDDNSDGIAGVISSGFNPASVNTLATSRSDIKSPFNYLTYTNGVNAGFMLSPLNATGWTTQASSAAGGAMPLLTIGLTDQLKSGFALQVQRLDIGNLFDPDILGTVTYNGTSILNTNTLLDTGTPIGFTIYNASENGSAILASNEPVQLTTAEGFSYNYTSDAALFQTSVQSTGQPRSIFGIDFFLNNSLLWDYTDHLIGLKNQ